MNILAMGLNYRTAPVEIRECFSLSGEALGESLQRLAAYPALRERVIVSTCNRTEIYAVAENLPEGKQNICEFLSQISGVAREALLPHLYIYADQEAVRHLFRVASGLDSMILGETQILGQVRDSFFLAQERGHTGSIFNQLFKRAVTAAKRAHTETDIGKNAVSVSYAAVELAKKIFDDLNNKTVLIIGAGKMSELTAKHLHASGARRVMVVNRTKERAEELATRFQGRAFGMESLARTLKEADIVISSTGAPDYIVTREMLADIMKQRRGRALFLFDIAVPRDLDPEINKLDNVYLYDIDDLEGVIAQNLQEREREAEKVGLIIGEEMAEFKQWLNQQQVVPLITALRAKGDAIQQSVMHSLKNKLPHLTEREQLVLEKHTHSIVNQLLRDPIQQVKKMALEPDSTLYLEVFARIFALQSALGEKDVAEEGKTSAQNLTSAARGEADFRSHNGPKIKALTPRKEATQWQKEAASYSMMR